MKIISTSRNRVQELTNFGTSAMSRNHFFYLAISNIDLAVTRRHRYRLLVNYVNRETSVPE